MQFRIGSYLIWVGKAELTVEEERIAAIVLKKRIKLLKEKEILQVEVLRLKTEERNRKRG